jgi:hypothetical protein
MRDVMSVDQDLPSGDLVEAGEQVDDRALAGAGPTDERHRCTGLDQEADAVEHGRLGIVAEVHVLELHAGYRLQGRLHLSRSKESIGGLISVGYSGPSMM